MKWISQDIEKFLQSKEYVDTAVLPLLPVSLGNDMKQSASMSEFISLLSVQLERQFRGRVMMLPGFSYLKSATLDKHNEDIRVWEDELFANGFRHVFHVTSDSSWKGIEDRLNGSLIWLPSIPLEHLEERNRISILEDQVKQLLTLFMQKWENGESR
ncbi:YpiF family protein [Bacillus sp. FJAT-29937]|uniref:YpiF family protein n=1 Tax=Bacillus sp. FJAT-29937 TaxID=1720553 RepID=UPI00082CB387|nr:YpiF family protein [Bacillus sp. FJAT-29937]